MKHLPELHSQFDLSEARIDRGQLVERRLSDLAGCFEDEDSFAKSLAKGNPLIYQVSSQEPGNGLGDMHFGIGMLMPGRIGDEYYLTKGHLHESREAAEVYICLSGTGAMLLEHEQTGDVQLVPMTSHSFVYVPGYTAHRTVNTGTEPLRYIGVYPANAGHDYQTIAKRGFRHRVVATTDGPQLLLRESHS